MTDDERRDAVERYWKSQYGNHPCKSVLRKNASGKVILVEIEAFRRAYPYGPRDIAEICGDPPDSPPVRVITSGVDDASYIKKRMDEIRKAEGSGGVLHCLMCGGSKVVTTTLGPGPCSSCVPPPEGYSDFVGY